MEQKSFTEQVAYIVQRAYGLNLKGKKHGLLELADDIDVDGLKRRDILEFGIRLISDGTDFQYINDVLSNMINTEQDETAKRIKLIQKEAVQRIYEGISSLLLISALFSLLNSDEQNEVQELLKDKSLSEYFSMY